jgi:hypothetical protein
MRRTLGVLAALLVLGLAANASAYDFLYTGDTAMTHDAGAFGLKVNFNYMMATAGYDQNGDKQDFDTDVKYTQTDVPVDVYYSVMDQFELGVQPKFRMLKWEGAGDDQTGTGIGDTWIKAKYMFMPEPMVTARLAAKIATGDNEPNEGDLATGDGQMDLDGALLLGMPAGSGSFDAAVGYRMRMEDDNKYKPGNEIHFMAGYTYHLSEMMNLKIAADGYFGSDPEFDGNPIEIDGVTTEGSNAVWVNPCIEYTMENGLQVGANFHYPLMGKNELALWGLGVFVGWGM